MRKIKRAQAKLFASLVTTAVVLGFVFQNCSQVRLEKLPEQVELLSLPPMNLKSHVCPQARFGNGESTKYVFITDLSASNFGGWRVDKIGSDEVYYWDPQKATDANSARFKAINFFLNECGNQQGAQFALIGFSNSAGVLANGKFSCDNVAFTSKEAVTSQLNAFEARKAADESWYKRWQFPNYLSEETPDNLIYGATSYTSASNCLERLVTDDLTINSSNQADRYFVFFISDGLPEDKYGTGCNLPDLSREEQTKCYLRSNLSSLTITRTAALSKGKDLRLQGVYYNTDRTLTPEVLDALSKEGGTPGVVTLASLEDKENALCELVATRSAISYRPDVYTAFNMTAIRKNGVLQADSDMDGLTDIEEEKLGYDPQNPRSSRATGVLDGVCERLGGALRCKERLDDIQCDPNLYDKLGLTNCDLKLLNLIVDPLLGDSGVDFDRDGVPDFVEVVKGTDPGFADVTQDPDGDLQSTREELMRGTDPFIPDTHIPGIHLNQTSINFTTTSPAPSCSAGDWTLSADQMQTVPTLAVQNLPAVIADQQHLDQEQMMLIVYRMTPVNSVSPQLEYFSRFVKAKTINNGQAEQVVGTPSRLLPEDFKLIGRKK